MERTTIYAISMGGDTDTIASMAAAINGARVGSDKIPERLLNICEAADESSLLAEQLFALSEKRKMELS